MGTSTRTHGQGTGSQRERQGRRGARDSCVSTVSGRKTAAPFLRQAAGIVPFKSGYAVRTDVYTLTFPHRDAVKMMEFGARNKSRCVHPFSAQSPGLYGAPATGVKCRGTTKASVLGDGG